MSIRTCLLGLMLIVASVQGQSLQEYRGDWLLVNGMTALRVDNDGMMTLLNSGEKGKLRVTQDGKFTWDLATGPRSGNFSGGKLFLKNEQAQVPGWVALLEFRRGAMSDTAEVVEFAQHQQQATTNRFASIHRNMILNNLRMLDGAAVTFCLVNRVKTVRFEQIVGPDKDIKKLAPVDGEDYSKLDLTPGVPWKVVTTSRSTVTFDRR